MSDIDPTPDTPVTLGDRLGWWRGDIAARLTTLEQEVAALAGSPAGTLAGLTTQLTTVRTELESMRADLGDLRGASSVDLTQVHGLVSSGLFTAPDEQNQQLPWLFGLGVTAESIKEHWHHGQGLTAYVILENIYLLLVQIARSVATQTEGLPPLSLLGDIGSVGHVNIEGDNFAKWIPPIDGLTVSSDNILLTPNVDWTGYSVYIQTTAPSVSDSITDIPPNTWIELSGTIPRRFSVEQQYPIRGYLRYQQTDSIILYNDTISVIGAGGPRLSVTVPDAVQWVNIVCETNPRQLNLYLMQNSVFMAPGYALSVPRTVQRETAGTGWTVNVGDTAGQSIQITMTVTGYYTPFTG